MTIDLPQLTGRCKRMTDTKTAKGYATFEYILRLAGEDLKEDKSMNRKARKRILHRIGRALGRKLTNNHRVQARKKKEAAHGD